MSGGPRKFSEKIALLTQKQAEGNAAFDSIMVEVKSIVRNDNFSRTVLKMLLTKPFFSSNRNWEAAANWTCSIRQQSMTLSKTMRLSKCAFSF
jgi:hypothetical protein